MYGPPLDCKRRLWERKFSLRKCIQPLSEIIFRGHDDDPRALALISRTVSIDLFGEQVLRHAVCLFFRPRLSSADLVS